LTLADRDRGDDGGPIWPAWIPDAFTVVRHEADMLVSPNVHGM